jgi:hypothetical protein
MSLATCFEVRRDDLRSSRFSDEPLGELAPGAVELHIDRFALTANNVTYAVAGEAMRYWNFFPAEPGWGRVPVWGFADVARSTLPALPPGERLYGYFPMATHLVVRPESLAAGSFIDGSAHRAGLPPVYNQYRRVAADPGYDAALEDRQAVLQPLFITGWLLADLVSDEAASARSVVIASASSKTAIGLAASLARAGGVEVVGLTAARNAAFVEKLGCYDRVVAYDAISSLSASDPTVFVDMAGNTAVKAAVHQRFGDRLARSIRVGVTHWEQGSLAAPSLPGPKPEVFFAPTRIQKRTRDWGARALQERMGEAWRAFALDSRRWLDIRIGRGREAVERAYRETLEGAARPDEGRILQL